MIQKIRLRQLMFQRLSNSNRLYRFLRMYRRAKSSSILRTIKKIPNQSFQTKPSPKNPSLQVLYGQDFDLELDMKQPVNLSNPCPQCSFNRAKMIDWMLQVFSFFMPSRGWQGYFTCVDLFDRYLSLSPQVKPGQIHEIGLTCIFIAMKYTTFVHPSLKDLVSESCANKFTVKEIVLMESKILASVHYSVESLKLYRVINRIIGHCLVTNEIKQVGMTPDKVLDLCYRKIVELYLDPKIGCSTYLEIAIGIIKIVLDIIWQDQNKSTKFNKFRVLMTIELLFENDFENPKMQAKLIQNLNSNIGNFNKNSVCCYPRIQMSMYPLAKP